MALCSQRPAIHRFPGAMAKRVRAVCSVLVERYDGQAAERLAGRRQRRRGRPGGGVLPGFGREKAQIFTALLGKQYGVTPPGGGRPPERSARRASIARSPTSSTTTRLQRVRETKKAVKAERRTRGRRIIGAVTCAQPRYRPARLPDSGRRRPGELRNRPSRAGVDRGSGGARRPRGRVEFRRPARAGLAAVRLALMVIMAVGLFTLVLWQVIEAAVGGRAAEDEKDRLKQSGARGLPGRGLSGP